MRTDFSENAISAKVHALYGRRIVRSQYEELCRKHTTSEIAAYLKEAYPSHRSLNTVQPATVRSDQLESILHKGRYNKYLDLVKYATPKTREFYRSYVLNLVEIQLILQMIRLINIGRTSEFIVSYPAFAESDLRIGLGKLSKVKPMMNSWRLWKALNTMIRCCATAVRIKRTLSSTMPAVKWL